MRTFGLALTLAAVALLGGAAAGRADTSCTGPLSGTVNGNIVVPNGPSCTLSNATVSGDVHVRQNASLTIDATEHRRRSTAMSWPMAARPRFSKAG